MQITSDKVKITHNGETKEVLNIIDNNYSLLVTNDYDSIQRKNAGSTLNGFWRIYE